MSEENLVLNSKFLPQLTVHHLFYLLGSQRYCWKDIGEELKLDPEDLKAIENDYSAKSALCMIQMFDIWLSKGSQDWTRIIEILKKIEGDYAQIVVSYINELGRIEGIWKSRGFFCDSVKPMKKKCYATRWLEDTCCLHDDLAHFEVGKDHVLVYLTLRNTAKRWYELGIALKIEKMELDCIGEGPQDCKTKLLQLIQTAKKYYGFKFTWRKLINALQDIRLEPDAYALEKEANKILGVNARGLRYEVGNKFFSRRDFSIKKEALKKKLSILRKLPGFENVVTFEDLINKTTKDFTPKNRSILVIIIQEVGGTINYMSGETAQRVDDLLEEREFTKKIKKDLEDKKRELEKMRAKLRAEKNELADSLNSGKQHDKLRCQMAKIENKLQTVNDILGDSIQKLKGVEIDSELITKQLKVCKEELDECQVIARNCTIFMRNEIEETNILLETILAATAVGITGGIAGMVLGGISLGLLAIPAGIGFSLYMRAANKEKVLLKEYMKQTRASYDYFERQIPRIQDKLDSIQVLLTN